MQNKKEISKDQLASLIEENMGLVVLLSKSFKPKTDHELEEYIQLGRIATWKAIIKHNEQKAKLSTVIWHYVRWEILRYIEKKRKISKNINTVKLDSNIEDIKSSHININDYIPNDLSSSEIKVVEMKLNGYNFVDIGKDLGKSRDWANNTFKNAIKKIKNANK